MMMIIIIIIIIAELHAPAALILKREIFKFKRPAITNHSFTLIKTNTSTQEDFFFLNSANFLYSNDQIS